MKIKFILYRFLIYFFGAGVVFYFTDFFLNSNIDSLSIIKRNYLTVFLISLMFSFLDYRKRFIKKNEEQDNEV